MPKKTYTPGDAVTVADLEVGDLVFARRDHLTKLPSTPVKVVKLLPAPGSDKRRIVVQSPYQVLSPWTLGWLNPARELIRAVPVEA